MLRTLVMATTALLLGGCAAFNNLNNEVSTFGAWPAERKPASYVFERLPSQQAQPELPQMLEDSARAALEAAGFRAVTDPNEAEYLMQLGARITTDYPWIYNGSLFWYGGYGGYGGWRYGPGYGYGYRYGYGYGRRWPGAYWGGMYGPYGMYGMYPYDSARFERDVALLIRDRKTGELLYEARASNVGYSATIDSLLPAMFEAALKDFPAVGPNPRKVVVPISKL